MKQSNWNVAVKPKMLPIKNVIWESSNPAIAMVGKGNGLVTAVSEGETTISVVTEDGDFTDSITVTVIPASYNS